MEYPPTDLVLTTAASYPAAPDSFQIAGYAGISRGRCHCLPDRDMMRGPLGSWPDHRRKSQEGALMTIIPDGDGNSPALQEAMRELESAIHDARVAFDCIGLGEIERAHTSAVTARVAIDAAVIAVQAVLDPAAGHGHPGFGRPAPDPDLRTDVFPDRGLQGEVTPIADLRAGPASLRPRQ
jgi:hypothetical protein